MANNALEEYDLFSDSRYRSYVTAVDKALKSFEYTSEWADLISALGKLNKVLLSNVKYSVIPKRITISKRLAQCMHPALPSGVHLKALETYDIIFKCIGLNRLSQELFIYSAGLFPLLGHAAMNVKPVLLTIYETHFVPLGQRLRPGLNGFLTGVLPGLEEGSDYYERIDQLLMKVCDGVEKSFFYGSLWRCIMSNPSIRLPAICFITSHFNKKLTMEDQLYIIGTDIDTMVHAICSSLQDSSVLVQRCALDLLLLGFPVYNSQLVSSDMVKIVTSAVTVVLRRDMSLNRRLFGWLLGNNVTCNVSPTSDQTSAQIENIEENESNTYFEKYSKDYLLQAVKMCFDSPENHLNLPGSLSGSPVLWSYRLLISLLDRPEISSVILDEILIEVFRSLYKENNNWSSQNNKTKESKNNSELIKTANLLFGTFEPYYLWEYLARIFQVACIKSGEQTIEMERSVQYIGAETPTVHELCILIEFLLNIVSLETYPETRTEYLPDLLTKISNALAKYCDILMPAELSSSLQLCSKLLSKVQPVVISVSSDSENDNSTDVTVDSKSHNVPYEQNCANTENSINHFFLNSQNLDKKVELIIGLRKVLSENPDTSVSSSEHVTSNDSFDGNEKQNLSLNTVLPTTSIGYCVESVQNLFVKFVKLKLFDTNDNYIYCFNKLLAPKIDGEKQREQKLKNLLLKCLGTVSDETIERTKKEQDNLTDSPEEISEKVELNLKSDALNITEAFQNLCHLFVELSSFPMYCTTSKHFVDVKLKHDECLSLPEWLKMLLVISCFVNVDDFHFPAITTIVELIALTQSIKIAPETNQTSPVPASPNSVHSSSSVVSVVIVPMINSAELEYIWDEMMFFNIAVVKLWKYLDESLPKYHLHSVELLQQLHNLAKDSNVCEKIVCNSMASTNELEQVSAQKKFCILWHMTRDLRLKSTPTRMMRAFDRCLFLMLENLGKETGPQKAVSQCWLNHSLQRGDVARILEPILLILLHPDSARVSIQHVSVHCPKLKSDDETEQEELKEAKIYAISSVSGNVIYHVSDDSHTSSHQGSPEKKILALTSIINMGNKESKVVTSNSMLQDFELPSSHEREISLPISLFVNPFGSLMSLNSDMTNETSNLPDLTNVKRLDSTSRIINSFDDNEVESKPVSVEQQKEMSSVEIVSSILDEILNIVTSENKIENDNVFGFPSDYGLEEIYQELESISLSRNKIPRDNDNTDLSENQDYEMLTIHPLHSYILLYCQVYDSQKTMYALSSLKAVILTNPRVALCNMSTTNISSSLSSRGQELQILLARHRKSVFGNNFHGEINAESITAYRSSTFVEVIVSACLYYIRGYYPNFPQVRLTEEEVVGNRNVRLLCTEVLTLVFSELVGIVKDSGKSFASYLNDLLMRCKVQKILLHCLIASVYNLQLTQKDYSERQVTFTETIIEFSERPSKGDQDKEKKDDFQDTFQIYLLRLVATLIVLEDTIISQCSSEKDGRSGSSIKTDGAERTSRTRFSNQMSSDKYHPGIHIPSQPMLLTAIISALRQTHKTHLHTYWLSLVTSTLPFAGCSLTHLVISVVSQLCHNLEMVASVYSYDVNSDKNEKLSQELFETPPDYLLTIIEGLTTLCHYCLLDSPAPVSTPISPPPLPPTPSQPYAPGANASQIISNLLHVFSTSNGQKYITAYQEHGNSKEIILTTRRVLLSNMPRILASISSVWQSLMIMEQKKPDLPQPSRIMGSPKAVKQHILSFLSPISLNYGSNFMAAVAVVWFDYRLKGSFTSRKVNLTWSNEQLLLVQLVGAIKVLPMETVVQNVRQVLRQPPTTSYDKNKSNKKVPLEVNVLQFFLAYVQNTSGSQLNESRQSLLGLWRDGLQIVSLPPVQFHLLAILHEFVQKTPLIEDKKNQKDLQDVAQKLIEACSTVAGSCLEQTTWLWRNLAVRPGPQHDIPDSDPDVEEEPPVEENKNQSGDKEDISQLSSNGINNTQYYSVQALCVLAEYLAPVLDVVYASEEKEKVVPLLNSIMYYVTPYLRNHGPHNIPSFRACSQLLASVCTYQYTRKAWRKDVFELLLDSVFFQMDTVSIKYWQTIIDHLMTHDKTTFRDFMTRVAMAQSASLSLFSSKEQEYEQRAQLLKRLAFVLFCSEVDQYQRFMPDIQERLSECLRLPQVPSVQAQVFLCFRVLLIRVSSEHVTSLWPVIITEMVQVFLQVEHELWTDSEEFRKIPSSHLRRLSTLDSTWVVTNSNGLNAHNHPAWLQLYLSTCKLLDMAVALPSDMLPQFQMYRWAFVGDSPSSSFERPKEKLSSSAPSDFTPHIVRIAARLNKKFPSQDKLHFSPGKPLLDITNIKSLQELQPFFNTMADITTSQHCMENTNHIECIRSGTTASEMSSYLAPIAIDNKTAKTTLQSIEHILERDFLEIRPG
ncbi:protein dopey-1-like [Centruroides sculpturatus]|uniref:protein dopey-1-like n=1 Tax=Centruroides sculpturatus TaxID=218467 RepID=UPI000C6EFC67|nr:protein dopey-1-like [Centruroides sculpturatus]